MVRSFVCLANADDLLLLTHSDTDLSQKSDFKFTGPDQVRNLLDGLVEPVSN